MSLYTDHNGIIRLFDGTIVYVVEIQYSTNGSSFWESKYNPFTHTYENDSTVVLDGHKYMRVRHAGDTTFQTPMYISAVDGKTPEIRIEGSTIQWGFSDVADSWTDLIPLDSLKGAEGDVGPEGKGLAVNATGWYGEFSRSYPTTGCTTCNRTGETIGDPWLVLSLGDGVHLITATDLSNGKYRSNDGITWIAIGTNDVGRYTRYMADDNLGSNYIDYRKTNTEYNSQGKVYAYKDGVWTELDGITSGNYLVAARDGEIGKFLEDFSSDTIGLDIDNNLEVIDDSIDVDKLKSGTFTHGLEEGASIKVNPTELEGLGVRAYVATDDSEKHFQVFVSDFISDGLTEEPLTSVEGEANVKQRVYAPDLINNTSGLEAVVQLDGYEDFVVKAGDAIEVDADGVNVVADELTIAADGQTEIFVLPTDNNTLGIQAKHLHANVADTNKGIKKGAGVTDPLEVKVDASSIGFDATGNLEIPDNGVQGTHLNDNVADETKGIRVLADALIVKLATLGGLEFNGSGEIQIVTSDILTDNVVKSLNGLVNDLILDVDNTGAGASGISLSVDEAGSTITMSLDVDINALKTYLGIIAGTYSPVVHTHTISDVTGLQDELDSKVEEGDLYDSNTFQVDSIYGPVWKSTDGSWWKITVDDLGNMTPVKVTI